MRSSARQTSAKLTRSPTPRAWALSRASCKTRSAKSADHHLPLMPYAWGRYRFSIFSFTSQMPPHPLPSPLEPAPNAHNSTCLNVLSPTTFVLVINPCICHRLSFITPNYLHHARLLLFALQQPGGHQLLHGVLAPCCAHVSHGRVAGPHRFPA
jgi:hypothetical protein